LNGQNAHCTNVNEDRPILSATKRFWKYKVHADIHRDSYWRGRQMTVGLSTTAIVGDLSGYFFGNFRDKAGNII